MKQSQNEEDETSRMSHEDHPEKQVEMCRRSRDTVIFKEQHPRIDWFKESGKKDDWTGVEIISKDEEEGINFYQALFVKMYLVSILFRIKIFIVHLFR